MPASTSASTPALTGLVGPAGAACAPPERVLLIHPGALGDFVQALPAFGAVRAHFGRARVALLTDAALAGLAHDTGLFDEVLGFDAESAYRGGPAARLGVLAALARRARRARPDVAAVFKGAPVWAALAAASGARWRAGLARGVGARLLTHPIPVDPTQHLEDRYLAVAATLGLDPGRRVAAAWPERLAPIPAALSAVRPLIGLAPGGARNAKQDYAAKRWPAARFAALARDLATAYPDAAFVLLGGAGDRAEVDAVCAALAAERVADLAGQTDVPAARAAIAGLDVFVGNDSGLMHVAATTGTPAVIAFGPTDPRVLAPRTGRVRAVWHPAPNPPCYAEVDGARRVCQIPCCIDRVEVAHMRAAVDELLAAAVPRRA